MRTSRLGAATEAVSPVVAGSKAVVVLLRVNVKTIAMRTMRINPFTFFMTSLLFGCQELADVNSVLIGKEQNKRTGRACRLFNRGLVCVFGQLGWI